MSEAPEIDHDAYTRRTLLSLLTGGAASALGFGGWRWVQGSPAENNIPEVLRTGHEVNERIWSTLFRDDHQARTFSRDAASILRVNGTRGMSDDIDLSSWQLEVQGPDGSVLGTHTLDDIKALPFHEMNIEHKCIEGWAQITNWQGARFSDFMDLYADQLPDDISDVYIETPDSEYYVNVDLATMRHDQTLLAYDNFDEPINDRNGAPLRLATPLKYGIKQIKRVGMIQFRTEQGGDFWGERGYDWYAGL